MNELKMTLHSCYPLFRYGFNWYCDLASFKMINHHSLCHYSMNMITNAQSNNYYLMM